MIGAVDMSRNSWENWIEASFRESIAEFLINLLCTKRKTINEWMEKNLNSFKLVVYHHIYFWKSRRLVILVLVIY